MSSRLWTLIGSALYLTLLAATMLSAWFPADSGIRTATERGGTAVTWVMPASVAWDAGIRPGDRIVGSDAAAGDLLIQPRQRGGKTLRFNPAAEHVHIKTRAGMVVTGGLVFLLCLSALTRTGWSARSRMLIAPLVVVAVGLTDAPDTAVSRGWALALMFGCILCLGPAFLETALFFSPPPKRFGRAWHGYRAGLLAIVCIAVPLYTAALLTGGASYPAAQLAEHISLGAGVIGGAAVLVRQTRLPRTKTGDTGQFVVLCGAAVGLVPFAVLLIVPRALGIALPPPHVIAAFLLVPPLAYAYAVQRYRLLDLPTVWDRRITRALGAASLAIVYLLLLGFLLPMLRSAIPNDAPTILAIAFGLGLSAIPLAYAAAHAADRLIFHDAYSHHEAVRHIVDEIGEATDVRVATAQVLRDVRSWLDLAWLALMVEQEHGWTAHTLETSSMTTTAQARLATVLSEHGRSEPTIDEQTAIAASFPLDLGISTKALLLAGPKANGERLRHGDRDILAVLATMLGVQLGRAKLLGDLQDRVAELEQHRGALRQLGQRLRSAQEAERKRIAAEVHDGPLQLLHALLRALDRHAPVDECRALAADAAAELRVVCSELRPPALDDLGLPAALTSLARRMGPRAACPISVAVLGYDDGRLPREAEVAIYRITQEALANCARHAGASAITVLLRMEEGLVSLDVCDDGRGFESREAVRALNDSLSDREREHLGLLEMRESASTWDGTLTITSAPGQGAQIRALFPLAASQGES